MPTKYSLEHRRGPGIGESIAFSWHSTMLGALLKLRRISFSEQRRMRKQGKAWRFDISLCDIGYDEEVLKFSNRWLVSSEVAGHTLKP